MGKKMIKLTSSDGLKPIPKLDRVISDEISIKDFFELHDFLCKFSYDFVMIVMNSC